MIEFMFSQASNMSCPKVGIICMKDRFLLRFARRNDRVFRGVCGMEEAGALRLLPPFPLKIKQICHFD